jgi:choline kinase
MGYGVPQFLSQTSRMKMTSEECHAPERITTALLLAAGTGSRLLPLTQDSPKCMTLVSEISILGRLVENLRLQGFKKLVVVTGYLSASIEDFLGTMYHDMIIEYVHSPFYKTTNNIYSLWKAKDAISEPFVLVESDLVFDHSLLEEMTYPDRLAVAGISDWMNGTTVTIDADQKVVAFENDTLPLQDETKYKTVNIYSFSLDSWKIISKRLDEHINEEKVNGYYETVFSELVNEGSLSLKAVSFDKKPWYEIDTVNDLSEAVKLFPKALLKETSKPLHYEIA